jgi:two-component system chemotaxis response regulator CheY
MKTLVVDDDFTCRILLQTFLSEFGVCHAAVNGKEAVGAVRAAIDSGSRYDLICMDILMPEMDGEEAVRQARALEEAYGIRSMKGAKIVMTTNVSEVKKVLRCFSAGCDAHLVKPIDTNELLVLLRSFQLIPEERVLGGGPSSASGGGGIRATQERSGAQRMGMETQENVTL